MTSLCTGPEELIRCLCEGPCGRDTAQGAFRFCGTPLGGSGEDTVRRPPVDDVGMTGGRPHEGASQVRKGKATRQKPAPWWTGLGMTGPAGKFLMASRLPRNIFAVNRWAQKKALDFSANLFYHPAKGRVLATGTGDVRQVRVCGQVCSGHL